MESDKPPVFTEPENPEIKIWRYMDFTKFVSMLENRGIFLARADMLGDPFEGSFSRENERMRPIVHKDLISRGYNPEDLKDYRQWLCSWMMISCWHMNENESAAMWKLYAKSNEAISIQSTYSRLRDSFDIPFHIGVVKYIDYKTEWLPEGNSFYPFIHKRKSFTPERELRVIKDCSPYKDHPDWFPAQILDYEKTPPPGGIWHSLNLDNLIERVYVAPTSPIWFKELVKQVLKRYELNKPVNQSLLDDEPFF